MALNNTVAYLKGIRFLQLTLAEKLQIKAKGRHCPDLVVKSGNVGTSNGKHYTRKFNSKIYEKHQWLTGCLETNALYCFPCLLFGGESTWTKVGMKDLNHLQRNIKAHENSERHANNAIDLAYLGSTNILTELDTGFQIAIAQHNEKVAKNRNTMSKLIDLIKFCGKFELPLRGHDESAGSANPGVFRGLVDLVCEFDSALKSHMESNVLFKGISKTTQNDILSAILQVCKEEITKEIKSAEFLAIMTDETTDIAEKSQVVVTYRYLRGSKPVERFWSFFNPDDLTSETLSNLLQNELHPLIGEDPQKLVAQTYDGAAVLSGVNRGVQARIKEVYNNVYFVHCYAHQLNLILQRAASQNRNVRIFFASLVGIPTFFSRSSQRVSALEQIAGNRRVPRPSSTRWNFKSRTVNMVSELRKELIECFTQLTNSNSTETVAAAVGLKRMMFDPEFNFWLSFFSQVMPHVDIFYSQLQARSIDAITTAKCLDTFTLNIQRIRDACDTMNMGELAINTRHTDVCNERRRDAKEVCDVILMQCQERFCFSGHLEANRQLDSNNFGQFSHQFPDTVVNNITSLYPSLDKHKLRSELQVL